MVESPSNGASIKGPWWIIVVERMGGLGIVLIMLVGLFFLARDFTNDMRDTWQDIYTIIQADMEKNTERLDGMVRRIERLEGQKEVDK